MSVSVSVNDPKYDADQNIIGLLNVLNFYKKYSVKKILFASCAAVYGIPESLPVRESSKTEALSFYGLTKLTGEQYIKIYSKLHGLKYVIFRYANVYGERQDAHGEAGAVAIFSIKILAEEEICIEGDGNQTRAFIYVKDVARANYLAVKENVENQIFNIGTNSETSINELAETMKANSEYNKKIIYRESRKGYIRNSRLDNTNFMKNSSWKVNYSIEKAMSAFPGKIKECR